MAIPVLVRRPNLVGVLEAFYAQDVPEQRWFADMLRVFEAVLNTGEGLGIGVVAHGHDYRDSIPLYQQLSPQISPLFDSTRGALHSVRPALFRATWYPGSSVVSHRAVAKSLKADDQAQFDGYREIYGWYDAIACFAYPQPGVVGMLCVGIERRHTLTLRDRHVLGQLAGHMDSALRLRMRPDTAVAAVIAPDGRIRDICDRSLSRARRDWFGHRVTLIEASRRKSKDRRANIDRWWALFAGQYSIIPIEDRDGQRHYLLVRNSPEAEQHARFSLGEIDVVRAAARGLTNKAIAYNLGISAAAVSERLLSAALKVGLSSRHALVNVASKLFGLPATAVELQQLTPTEREILRLLQRGLSNADISRLRGRSLNTVRNQVATVLRKTGSPSRRSLKPM